MRILLLLSLIIVCYCYHNINISKKSNINSNRITSYNNINSDVNNNGNVVKTIHDDIKDNLKIRLTTPLLLGLGSLSSSLSLKANANDINYDKQDSVYSNVLPTDAYTTVGNMKMCKIINGMWQVSGITIVINTTINITYVTIRSSWISTHKRISRSIYE